MQPKEDLSEEEGEKAEEIDEADETQMGTAADVAAADVTAADGAAETAGVDAAETGIDIVDCSSSVTNSSSITEQGHVEN